MKKILISVLFLFVTMVSYSQIKVLSIEPDEADLTARINPKQDDNDNRNRRRAEEEVLYHWRYGDADSRCQFSTRRDMGISVTGMQPVGDKT